MHDEVTTDERLEIDRRLYKAQRHFEDARNMTLHDKARLGEKFGGMLAHVTRYDLSEAEEFSTKHGFGRDAAAQSTMATDEPADDWTSVHDALPTIPEGHDSAKVYVKHAPDDLVSKAFYLRQVGLEGYPGPGFALDVPILDFQNRVLGTGPVPPLTPTHWRLRDA
ncbi:hypothetical protein [Paraburkholderia sp. J67]|uniref:hypothetical protein n=1 Tax=Paraburkholderia sp. J67 TaxID=2805435 RepID=UPI002ABDF3B7|nr:hypothetical protein [Paraburkholderia sp. J67]